MKNSFTNPASPDSSFNPIVDKNSQIHHFGYVLSLETFNGKV